MPLKNKPDGLGPAKGQTHEGTCMLASVNTESGRPTCCNGIPDNEGCPTKVQDRTDSEEVIWVPGEHGWSALNSKSTKDLIDQLPNQIKRTEPTVDAKVASLTGK
jgi:hypothetical protein